MERSSDDLPGDVPDESTAYGAVLALKHMGFSLEEMRQLTMAEFVCLTEAKTREAKTDPAPKVRDATQADLDTLFG